MFAVYAESFSSDDPLSGLVVGERPDPEAPDGWTTVDRQGRLAQPPRPLVAARRRAHEEALPMILGCDAAGLDEDGNEVVVHAVISDPTGPATRPSTRKRSLLSERYQGTFAERVVVPRRNLVPKPASLSLRGGGLPADGLADGLPDALHPGRPQGRRHRARPGRRRRGGHRADRAGAGRRARVLGDQPRRGQADAGARARRARGLRVRRAAAGEGRRRDGDRRPGHLVALDPVAAPRRRGRRERHDVRAEARRRRADPGVLPPAAGDRLDDGHPRRAGRPGARCSTRPASGR